jgi:hypothetical protein
MVNSGTPKATPAKAISRVLPALAVALLCIAPLFFLVWGIADAVNSRTVNPLLVIGLSAGAPIVLTVLSLVVYTRRSAARLDAVRQRRPGCFSFVASGRYVGTAVSDALIGAQPDSWPKQLGSYFVVCCGTDGLEFWSGSPSQPRITYELPWESILRVGVGVAFVSREVPGVHLDTRVTDFVGSVDFAVARTGFFGAWVELRSQPVERVAELIRAHRARSIVGAE